MATLAGGFLDDLDELEGDADDELEQAAGMGGGAASSTIGVDSRTENRKRKRAAACAANFASRFASRRPSPLSASSSASASASHFSRWPVLLTAPTQSPTRVPRPAEAEFEKLMGEI